MGYFLPGVPDAHAVSYLVLLSVFLPYLISLVQQRHWSNLWRTRVSFLICSVVSGAVLWNEGQLDLAHWLTTGPVFFALTAMLYSKFARKNGAAALEDVSTRVLQAWLGTTAPGPNPSVESKDTVADAGPGADVKADAKVVEDADVLDQST